MIGHLGSRVSALLDGQMSAEETERAWTHVHACHQCRDLVEREGWVKTRLAGLSFGSTGAPDHLTDHLKGSLVGRSALSVPADVFLEEQHHAAGIRRSVGLAALGGGALGAAVMGVLVLGVGPAQAPTMEERAPVTHLNAPTARLVAPLTTGRTPTGPAATAHRHAAR